MPCQSKLQRKNAGTSSWPSWISHFTGSFVGHSPSEMLCPPALFKKGEEGRKKKEVLHLSRCYTHTHRHAYTNTRTFTHSTFTHDSITHIHPTFSHYCIHSFTHLPSTYFFCTHRSFIISFLFPAFPIPSSHFFGCLLEEVDTSGPLILNQLVPEKNCCIPEPRLYSQGSWHIATSIQ